MPFNLLKNCITRFSLVGLISLVTLGVPLSCIDPQDIKILVKTDVLVVDGAITNLPEPQIIKLSRAQADRLTGQYRTSPLIEANVEVVVDSSQVIAYHETIAGNYQ